MSVGILSVVLKSVGLLSVGLMKQHHIYIVNKTDCEYANGIWYLKKEKMKLRTTDECKVIIL